MSTKQEEKKLTPKETTKKETKSKEEIAEEKKAKKEAEDKTKSEAKVKKETEIKVKKEVEAKAKEEEEETKKKKKESPKDKKALISTLKKSGGNLDKLKKNEEKADQVAEKLLEFVVPDIDRYKKRLKKSVLENDLTNEELKLIIETSLKYRARATYIREERIKNKRIRRLLEGDSNKKPEPVKKGKKSE